MKSAMYAFSGMVVLASALSAEEPNGRKQDQPTHEQIQAAVQEICPVSGENLGEHGPPIAVTVGKQKEKVLLCCEACLKQKIDVKHWGTIHGNMAKAQKICPVMKKELPENPKWTIVEGQVVFVCCPPCTKKIAAEPEAYLQRIDELYLASLKDREHAH